MLWNYCYHENIRKTIITFGRLFDKIEIRRKDNDSNITSVLQVPLSYGPVQKFLARLNQAPDDLNPSVQVTLPRMSFEITGINYDSVRKTVATQMFLSHEVSNKNDIRKAYMPVPYDLDIDLSIITKYNDDMLQIIEQILPYFQPSFNLPVYLIEDIGEKRDIPIILNNISIDDDYEGSFDSRRSLTYTLRFTAKTYLCGPVYSDKDSNDIIRKVSLGFVSGESNKSSTKDVTYSVEPQATQSYTQNIITDIVKDIEKSDVIITVNDSSKINSKSYISINDETLYVKSKKANLLSVRRGEYNTPILMHVSGSKVKSITDEDDLLVQSGDNFGFDDSFI